MAGGYSIVVAGTAITASRENQYVSRQVITRHASATARNSAIATDAEEGMFSDLADVDTLERYDGARWVPYLRPYSATVATSQTSSSTTFTDLSTAGPAVTVNTGTSALVTVTASLSCSVADGVYMGVAVSGASTIAADATKSLGWIGTTQPTISASFMLTGLTPGSNTFTAKYRTAFSGTGTWANRSITVVPL